MHVISIVYDKNSLKNAAKCLWHIVEIEKSVLTHWNMLICRHAKKGFVNNDNINFIKLAVGFISITNINYLYLIH